MSNFCKCADKLNCCCLETAKKLKPGLKITNKSDKPKNSFDNIFSSEKERTICNICKKYSSKSLSKKQSGNWSIKGMLFHSVKRKNEGMKKHLVSKEHLNSLINHKNEERDFKRKGIPNQNLREKCTENLLRAVVFIIQFNLTSRALTEL